jgi:hypothetical protein
MLFITRTSIYLRKSVDKATVHIQHNVRLEHSPQCFEIFVVALIFLVNDRLQLDFCGYPLAISTMALKQQQIISLIRGIRGIRVNRLIKLLQLQCKKQQLEIYALET